MTITTTTTVAPETDGGGNEDGEAESSGCGCNSAQGAAYWLALLPMVAFARRREIND
jgi:MYXO-CTERM domain-containing protein